MSALRELLATETTSHDASKPICHFCLWLVAFRLPQSLAAGALGQERKSLRPVCTEKALRELLGAETTSLFEQSLQSAARPHQS